VSHECTAEGCSRKRKARGLCDTHYRRVLNGYSPRIPQPPAEERFWAKVDKSGDCWLWTGAKVATGHGNMKVNGKPVGVHRFSYELAYGPIPQEMVIDHICRRGQCVNPEHLRAVTQKQNMENRGGAHANSKTGIRGVMPARNGKWRVEVRHNSRRYHVGTFDTLAEAEGAAIAKRNELFTCNDADRKEAIE